MVTGGVPMAVNDKVEMRLDVKVPMTDGVNLSVDIYLPTSEGPFPTVLIRTPYSNNSELHIEKGLKLAEHGYACVIQDCRGRWDSDGEFYPVSNEGPDGYDTQEWVGRQEWCDGNIGMSGGSYGGLVQWLSAPHRSEFIKCLAPRVICTDFYNGLLHPGGAFQLGVAMTWGMRTNGRTAQSIEYHNWTEALNSLPLIHMDEAAGRNIPFWKDWIRHSEDDDYWQQVNVSKRFGEIIAPAFNMGGWYDLYVSDTFDNFNGLRLTGGSQEAMRSKLIVGPWPHGLSSSSKTGDVDFGLNSLVDLDAIELRWFDYWLKGIDNGIVDEAPIRLFIMGSNQWRDEHEWPLARTEWRKWYLHSEGNANSVMGNGLLTTNTPGDEPSDHFTYDPRYPVQTVGGNNCCSPHILPWGPHDQRPVEARSDVLCYTSEPLESDLELTGPIKLVLYAATDCHDTDWTGKLVDVSPDGYAKNLCDGIIRARYRKSFTEPELLEPHNIYKYEIEVGVTGNVFRRGHRIRIDISSSNFPRFDRNLNTGNVLGVDDEMRTARQTVFHSSEHPSHVIFPVIPAK